VIFLNFNHTPNHIRGAMRHLITHLIWFLAKGPWVYRRRRDGGTG
jgi:hypothetical protein